MMLQEALQHLFVQLTAILFGSNNLNMYQLMMKSSIFLSFQSDIAPSCMTFKMKGPWASIGPLSFCFIEHFEVMHNEF